MVKYPLTQKAKEAAQYLVESWDKESINQEFTILARWVRDPKAKSHLQETIRDISSGQGIWIDNFVCPSIENLKELALFGLINFELGSQPENYHVLLLQELRNAVETDFEVSEYFLTFNAVGTIIQGNATISAPFQSSASVYGNVTQNISPTEIADKLLTLLDTEMLQDNGIVNAIRELQTSIESERQSKVGKVISELGRSLQHGANAFVVMQALSYLAQVIR